MDFIIEGSGDDTVASHDIVASVEHQFYQAPFVGVTDAKHLWNATMDGQSPTYANTGSGPQYVDSPGAKSMSVWFDILLLLKTAPAILFGKGAY